VRRHRPAGKLLQGQVALALPPTQVGAQLWFERFSLASGCMYGAAYVVAASIFRRHAPDVLKRDAIHMQLLYQDVARGMR
jgi:hypothetical protein